MGDLGEGRSSKGIRAAGQQAGGKVGVGGNNVWVLNLANQYPCHQGTFGSVVSAWGLAGSFREGASMPDPC